VLFVDVFADDWPDVFTLRLTTKFNIFTSHQVFFTLHCHTAAAPPSMVSSLCCAHPHKPCGYTQASPPLTAPHHTNKKVSFFFRSSLQSTPPLRLAHTQATANTPHPLPVPLCMHPSSSPLPYLLLKHLDKCFFFSFFIHLISNRPVRNWWPQHCHCPLPSRARPPAAALPSQT
jgi:hypothetical protein